MGREIKRVPLSFKHPLNEVWTGYINPHRNYSRKCHDCGESGLNPASRELWEAWYDSGGHGNRWWYEYSNGQACKIIEAYPGACKRWSDKLTQDEVDALVKEGRFSGRTHNWIEGTGWVEKNPPVKITAEEVNASHSLSGGGHHDAINQGICFRVRANRFGIYGKCEVCGGEGRVITNPDLKKMADEWEPYEPPVGGGWQVWETVSEGSPISPVYPTAEALIERLVTIGLDWGASEGPFSREAAEAFVKGAGWVPSLVGIPGVGYVSGIEAAQYFSEPKEKQEELPFYLL
jgi:hypothetical protein